MTSKADVDSPLRVAQIQLEQIAQSNANKAAAYYGNEPFPNPYRETADACTLGAQALQIVEQIAALNPTAIIGGAVHCIFCSEATDWVEHTKDCLWRRCQQLKERT